MNVRTRLGFVGTFLALAAGLLGLVGCELTEMTLAEPDDVLLAEGYVILGGGDDQVTVFLHWTLGTGEPEGLGASEVKILSQDDEEIVLELSAPNDCLRSEAADQVQGACFSRAESVQDLLVPGSRAELIVRLPDGREVRGVTDIPRPIRMIQPEPPVACGMPPNRQLTFRWNRSEGAWAYSAETEITGLREALALQGIEVEADSIALLGLAVSEADTSIVFPREFGVFNRFDLQQEVAVALQGGFPSGARGVVAIGALDRNYVNWIRGGNFNPSGAVRVSSLQGDGVGVFGSVVRRSIRVFGGDFPGIPSCFGEP